MNKQVSSDQNTFETYFYTEHEEDKYYSLYKELISAFGCGYLGYVYEDIKKGIRIGFTTNPDWQNEYIGQHLIDKCHLWNTVKKHFLNTDTNFFILPWAMAQPESHQQNDIMLYRKEKGIQPNGISFCTKTVEIREYIALSPLEKEPNFLKHISNNVELIKKQALGFRRISLDAIKRNHLLKSLTDDVLDHELLK
jgi:hypothetical protein